VPLATAPDRNWGKVAAAVDVHYVPGHHHTMVKEPHVEVLARALDERLRHAPRAVSIHGGRDG
jgi:thioesterase domain-containing protein